LRNFRVKEIEVFEIMHETALSPGFWLPAVGHWKTWKSAKNLTAYSNIRSHVVNFCRILLSHELHGRLFDPLTLVDAVDISVSIRSLMLSNHIGDSKSNCARYQGTEIRSWFYFYCDQTWW
jgi:hypothetical protein